MHAPEQRPRLHHAPLAGRTVVVAPGRAGRPNELEGDTLRCPFCAGNESLTPPDLLRTPRSAAEPWRSRIVPNQFPIVTEVATCDRTAAGPTASLPLPAHGVHDVVIESAEHVASILSIAPARSPRAASIASRSRQSSQTSHQPAGAMVFKNSGIRAGASLEHVHSQLIALDFVP
ncbi:MAG: hypothetical protein ACKOK8_16885, partial [Planctomycetia bacterium]